MLEAHDADDFFNNMPPPAPREPRATTSRGSVATSSRKRPPNEKLDFDEHSDSESMGEATLRHTDAARSTSSSRRRRRRHSHSQSSRSLVMPAAPAPPPVPTSDPLSESLNMNGGGPGAGVFRDRISSEDANPAELSEHEPVVE